MTTLDSLIARSSGKSIHKDAYWLILCVAITFCLMGASFTLALYLNINATLTLVTLTSLTILYGFALYSHLNGHLLSLALPRKASSALLGTALSFFLFIPLLHSFTQSSLPLPLLAIIGTALPFFAQKGITYTQKIFFNTIEVKIDAQMEEITTLMVELATLAKLKMNVPTPQIELIISLDNKPFAKAKWNAAVHDKEKNGIWHAFPQTQAITIHPSKAILKLIESDKKFILRLITTPKLPSAHEQMAILAARQS